MKHAICLCLLTASRLPACSTALAEESSSKSQVKNKSEENKFLAALERELKFQQSTITDLKKRGNLEFSVAMFNEDAKLIKQQIVDAKRLIAAGKPFGKEEFDLMAKERKRASAERLARSDQESKQEFEKGMADAAAEREAAIQRATGEFAEAQGQAAEQYRSAVAPADLMRKFRTSNGQLRLVIWNLPQDGAL